MAKFVRRTTLILLALVVAVVAGPTLLAWLLARGDTFSSVERTPARDVTLVLGAGLQPDGKPARFLQARLDLAADLYKAGRTKVLLLSGGSADYYSEPRAMQEYLVKQRGIPVEDTVLDELGSDTYSSCIRAKKVYGVNRLIVVTQSYHLTRSVATCQLAGVDVVGLGDTSVSDSGAWNYGRVRELGATMKMVWEFVRGREPVLGPKDTSVQTALARR